MKYEVVLNGDRGLLNSKSSLALFSSRNLTRYSIRVANEIVINFHNKYTFYSTGSNLNRLEIDPLKSGKFVIIHDENSWKTKITAPNILNVKFSKLIHETKKLEYLWMDLFIAERVGNILILEATTYSKNLEILSTYCAEKGINVFCLPGKITDRESEGSNRIIFNGAIPLYTLDLLNI